MARIRGETRRTSSSTGTPGQRSARATELPLTPDEIERVRGLGDELDLDEVQQVYLPLSRLLSLYVEAAARSTGRPSSSSTSRSRRARRS